MPVGGGRITDVGYNLQVAVDPKHKLIVDHQVTNAVTEKGLLSMMALRAKQALGVDRLEVLTDMGYYDGQQVKACLESGITPYIPKPTLRQHPLGPLRQRRLPLRSENDCYRCPAGNRLLPLAIHREGTPAQVLHHTCLRPLHSNPAAPRSCGRRSVAGPTRTYWMRCSAGSAPALRR
jgi:hypothetical protein